MTIVRDAVQEAFERVMSFNGKLNRAMAVDDAWYKTKRSVHEIVHSDISNAIRLENSSILQLGAVLKEWHS